MLIELLGWRTTRIRLRHPTFGHKGVPDDMLAVDPIPHFLGDLIPVCAHIDRKLLVMFAALSGYCIECHAVMSVLFDALTDPLGNFQGELF